MTMKTTRQLLPSLTLGLTKVSYLFTIFCMSAGKNVVFVLGVLVIVLLIGAVVIKSSSRFSNPNPSSTSEEKQLQSSASASY